MRASILALLLLAGCLSPADEQAKPSPTTSPAPAPSPAPPPAPTPAPTPTAVAAQTTAATPTPAPSARLRVASAAFDDGAAIPKEHTCDGQSVSPPLTVTHAPPNATTLALIMYDPDAPTPEAPTRNITHWLLWQVPFVNGAVSIEKGSAPAGAVEGGNDKGATGYWGPCPPRTSSPHRYVFWAFALDAPPDLPAGSTRAQLEAAMRDHTLAEVSLTGTYARQAA